MGPGGMMGGNNFGGDLGGILGQLFGGGGNPYGAAMGQMGQFPGYLNQQLGPYSNMGHMLLPQLQSQYAGMMQNPGGVLSGIGQGFHQDPGYQWNLNQNLDAGNKAMAAGGMAGSPLHQNYAEQTASGLANQQYQNYLQNALGIYGQGLQGQQGLENQGFNASGQMSSDMGDYYANMAKLAAGQSQYQNQQAGGIGSFLGKLFL